ncbi:MAG: TraB/GumN family protein, partial [Flavobacteriales bacterium]
MFFFGITPDQGNCKEKNEKQEYPSLLWKITSDDTDNTSYLYGSMHVSDKVAFHLSDHFFKGIKKSEVVALETNPSIWMGKMMDLNIIKGLNDLSDHYNEYSDDMRNNFYKRAFHLGIPNKKFLSKALSSKHKLTNRFLFRSSGHDSDFEENTYLDLFIFRTGKKMGKEITSLEDYEKSMELYFKAIKPDEDGSIRKSYINYGGERQNVYDLMEDAYREGNLDKIDSITKLSATKNYMENLVFKRNQIMADNLDSLLQKKSIFAGIGAAHLPGEKGVIEILRDKGYTLKPVERKFTDKGKKKKKEVQEDFMKLEHHTEYAPDSSFYADMPGKLYETSNSGNYKEYYYPEMVNGAFYHIKRISTYSPLTGITAKQYSQKIDSLFYENIPGEILEKKQIQQNGYIGFKIHNKTRRGNHQKYKVFITPMEILIFKLGGTKDLVDKRIGRKFFKSLTFKENEHNSWRTYQPPHGDFKVDIKGRSFKHIPEANALGIGSKLHIQSYDKQSKDYFLLLKKSLHDHNYIEEDSFDLKQLTKEFANQLNAEIISQKQSYLNNSFPAINF